MRLGVVLAILCLSASVTTACKVAAASHHWGPAVLGATLSDFVHVYGAPMKNTSAYTPGWKPCPGVATAQLMMTILDGRALEIHRNACTGSLAMSMRRSYASLFLPRDAIAHGTVATTDVDGNHVRVLFYTSASLARNVPPGDFQDCNENTVKAGSITVNLHDAADTGMAMAVGTCP